MIDRKIKETEDIVNFIENQGKREQAKLFLQFAQKNNLRQETKITAKYYSLQFYPPVSPRALFKMDINEKTLRIKAQLFFADRHSEDLTTLSPSLKAMIEKTPACTRCSLNCKQGIGFKMDGRDFFTCINEGHYFQGMSDEQCGELILLLEKELNIVLSLSRKEE